MIKIKYQYKTCIGLSNGALFSMDWAFLFSLADEWNNSFLDAN